MRVPAAVPADRVPVADVPLMQVELGEGVAVDGAVGV